MSIIIIITKIYNINVIYIFFINFSNFFFNFQNIFILYIYKYKNPSKKIIIYMGIILI